MNKTFLLSIIAALFTFTANAATFNSNGTGGGNWSSSASWTLTSGVDADGIPDQDDDVTILAGDNITIDVTSNVNNLVVNGTFTGVTSRVLYIYGNYTLNGTETGSGGVGFVGTGTTISGSGSFSSVVRYSFSKSRTILAGTTMTKTGATSIGSGVTVTNQGTVTIFSVSTAAGAVWVNGATGVLTIRTAGFMTGRTFNATAVGNTVNIAYTTGTIPLATGYYNLNIAATSGVKTLPANTSVGGNLTINASNTLSTNNFDLSIGGNLTVNGTFTPSAGKTITFNGTAASQNITWPGSQTVYNVVINNTNGVNLASGNWTVRESLTATAGTFNAGTNTVTLSSDATNTARLGVTGATGGYSGSNYIVQRFISARNANWADMATTVSNSTLNDWDQEIYMSGVGGNDGNATDASGNIWYSVYTYNEASATYSPLTSVGTALTPGKGYELYLGDNTISLSATTIDTRGTPTTGDQVIPVQNTGGPDPGWNLVGNPFASFIAWDNLQMSNLDATYYIFDNGTGTYAAYSAGTSIPPTQGFYVHSSSGSPSLTIPETAKTTSNSSTFLRVANAPDKFTLTIKGTSVPFSHKAELYLDENATAAFEGSHDALYLKSPVKEAPAIYMMSSDNNKLVKNAFSAADNTVNVPVTVMAGINDIYTIEISGVENLMGEYSCVMLEDRQENKMIDLSTTRNYTFSLNKGTDASRFVLHLSRNNNECERLAGKTDINGNTVQVINSSEGIFVKFDLEENTPATISMYNVLGQEVMSTSVEANKQTAKLDVPAGLDGIYFVNVQMSDRKVTEKVFLKSK